MNILIAMSESTEARLVAYLLRGMDNDIVVTTTIAEAASVMLTRTWSAVVLDSTLQDGSGFELLESLTKEEFEGAILMLSSSKELSLKVRALHEGADDYLVRPYEPAELVARMRAITRRSRRWLQRATNDIVRAGPIELDVNALRVTLPGNRRVRLTPSEMRLLHCLMTHTHSVVSHEELATRLLGDNDHTSYTNAISVYMRRIRRKIECDPERPSYIETVRGSGYRFNGLINDAVTSQ